MEVEKLADGLWRWTGELDDRTVAECLYLETPHGVVLFDPVVPPEDRERFLDALDRDIDRTGGEVVICLTHERKRERALPLADRYAATIWSPGAGLELPAGVVVASTTAGGAATFSIVQHETRFPL
jgi:hypothetical protein